MISAQHVHRVIISVSPSGCRQWVRSQQENAFQRACCVLSKGQLSVMPRDVPAWTVVLN